MTEDKQKITAEDIAKLFEKPDTAYLKERHYTEPEPTLVNKGLCK